VGYKLIYARRYLGDLGVDGRTILRWIFRKRDVGVQDRDRWRALVNEVMKLLKD
jgi:putative heme degradation protein